MTRAKRAPRTVNAATALPMPDRFWSKVDRRTTGECWEWLAYRNEDGYGVFNIASRRPIRAHRMAVLSTASGW